MIIHVVPTEGYLKIDAKLSLGFGYVKGKGLATTMTTAEILTSIQQIGFLAEEPVPGNSGGSLT